MVLTRKKMNKNFFAPYIVKRATEAVGGTYVLIDTYQGLFKIYFFF